MREFILDEIRRLAHESNGKPPGSGSFSRLTGISAGQWRGRYWAKWSEALEEAGFAPNDKKERIGTDEIMGRLVAALRHYRRVPSQSELKLLRRQDPEFPAHSTLDAHFGSKKEMLGQLRAWAESNGQEYADIVSMIPVGSQRTGPRTSPNDGFVYLLRSGQHFKVGRSDDYERRAREIRTSLPHEVVMVHVIRTDDPPGIEAYWHRRFAAQRANGEWFRLSPADVAAFKRRKYQ